MILRLLPTPPDYPKEQELILRRNLRMHLKDGSLYAFGMSFFGAQTIFPIFLKELGGDTLAIGSVFALWTIGANIPAAFMAQRLKQQALFRAPMVKWGFYHRLMIFICGVIALLVVGRIPTSLVVSLFLLLLFLTAAFGSISGVPWFQVYTKTVPMKLRGRLIGLRQLLGGAAGAVGGYVVGITIQVFSFPLNFSLLFFIGFGILMASWYYLSRVEEQPALEQDKNVDASVHFIIDAKRILKANKNFRNYLIADALVLMSLSSVSFYSIFALERFSLPPSYGGTFTAIFMATSIVSNIVFGFSGDYYGHKMNVMGIALCSVSAAVIAILSPNVFMYGFVFFFLACAIQTQVISRMPFVAELCTERERPLYVGITNTLTAPSMLLGILFGWAIQYIGYTTVFVVTALLAGSGFLVLFKKVVEPRTIKA